MTQLILFYIINIISTFYLINIKVLLLSLLRNLVIIRAPCEKNLSLVAEEAGIPKYFRAIKARQGNLEALDFQ